MVVMARDVMPEPQSVLGLGRSEGDCFSDSATSLEAKDRQRNSLQVCRLSGSLLLAYVTGPVSGGFPSMLLR